MPRNMSFSLTTDQMKNKTKTVTRRFAWWGLKPGDKVCAVEKAMGLKKGEKVKRIGLLKIIDVRREPLSSITKEDCIKEGYPEMEPEDFIKKLCDHYNIDKDKIVNRIEFEYL